MVIQAEIFVHQRFDILVFHLAVVFHQLADRTVVYVVSHALFGFYFVAVGHGHVVHLVAEADDEHVLCIGPCGAYTHPHGYFMLGLLIFPVTDHHFAADAHAGADVSEFSVAVGRLVQVHKVHVHRFPGNLFVELSMQVQQGLPELLQAVNPHLGGRERVHPGDDTDALLVVIGGFEDCFYFFRRVGRTFIYDLYRKSAAVIQSGYHFITVCVYCDDRIASIQKLRSCYEPYFVLVK